MHAAAIVLSLLTSSLSGSNCPDLSGKFVLQGEDGRVLLNIIQTRCDDIRVSRTTTNFAGSFRETHRLKLDGVARADSGWFGFRERNQVRARFEGEVLVLEIKFQSNPKAVTRYSLRLTPDRNICSETADPVMTSYFIQARVVWSGAEGEVDAARRSKPVKACP